MTAVYTEEQNILPKNAMMALVLIVVATDVFLLICTQLGLGISLTMFGVITVAFIAVVLPFALIKLRITVDDEAITVNYIRKIVVKKEKVIGCKIGDIDILRNYSAGSVRNTKYKNYVCHGYDRGVSLKIEGKLVITFTSADPEAVAALFPDKA